MAKTHTKILHERQSGANARIFMKKYYTSLFAIIMLIVVTAFALAFFGNENYYSNNSGNLVGMVVTNADVKWNFDSTTNIITVTAEDKTRKYEVVQVNNEMYAQDLSVTDQILLIDSRGLVNKYDGSTVTSYTIDGKTQFDFYLTDIISSSSGSTSSPLPEFSKIITRPSTDFNLVTSLVNIPLSNNKIITETNYNSIENTFTVVTDNSDSYTYEMVNIDGTFYAKYVDERESTKGNVYYYDVSGNQYKYDEVTESLVKTNEKSEYLLESDNTPIAPFLDLLGSTETNSFKEETPVAKESQKTQAASKKSIEKNIDYDSIASSLGFSDGDDKGIAAVKQENEAINKYLDENDLTDWDYNIESGTYSCDSCDIPSSYNSQGALVIQTSIPDGKGGKKDVYVYQEKSGLNRATYYTCDPANTASASDCTKGKMYTGDDLDQIKDAYATAKTDAEDTQKTVQNAMNSGDITITQDGEEVSMKTTLRQRQYAYKIYEQQEAQVVGLLSGYLNKWVDKIAGSFSRGAPAGICKYVLGFEYYKNTGWVSVPANTSSTQLQSQLIANSRTVMIEGEKEEITENLFRYAYTIRLLANQSLEWQTYLYNSCSGENSVEQFYDYGALAPGAYYAFHYAGSGEQDMTFDCAQEDCLYDQACVAFTDGTEPVCVSLAHGIGFETPNAGSDYDCI